MKGIISKVKELKKRYFYWRVYRNYYFDENLFNDNIYLKAIDPEHGPRCSFSLKHHFLPKLF